MASKPPQIVWCDIPCVDLERAISFYNNVLDIEVDLQEHGGFKMGIIPHSDTATGGCLAVMDGVNPGQDGPLIYLSVNGKLKDASARVEENGGKLLLPPHNIGEHGCRSVILDSEGNKLALWAAGSVD